MIPKNESPTVFFSNFYASTVKTSLAMEEQYIFQAQEFTASDPSGTKIGLPDLFTVLREKHIIIFFMNFEYVYIYIYIYI